MRTKALSAALFLAFLHSAFAQDSMTLNGSVTGSKNEAVEGATVQLYRVSVGGQDEADYQIVPAGETTSDAQGQFTFSVEKQTASGPVFHTCFGYKEGLSFGWRTLLGDSQTLDIKLTEPQKMIGFVQDPDGKPVANAEVRLALLSSGEMNFTFGLEPIDLFVSKTCDQGRFEFNRLPEGASAEILVKTEGGGILHPFVKGADFETGLSYKTGQTEIMLTMHKPCTVSGIVAAKEGQAPLEGIHIAVRQEESPVDLLRLKPVVSGADGTFEISQLPRGKYILQVVENPDWIGEPVRLEVAGNVGARIELQKGGLLEVRVVDGSNDQPIEKASISVRNRDGGQGYGLITDAAGIGTRRVGPGNYELYGFAEGFQRSRNTAVAVVESDKTTEIEIRLGGQQKLTGVVKNPDGKPAANVDIRIMPNQGMRQSVKTDADGRFVLAWNPEELSWTEGQCFLLAIDKDNDLAKAEPIDTETKELTVTLLKGATVKGKVLNEKGEPLKSARADLTFWGQRWGSSYDSETETNSGGEYVFEGVPVEQRYSVSIRNVKGYGSGSSRQFSADSSDEPVLVEDLVLKVADQKLSGQVVDVEGKPLADVSVNLNGQGQPNESVRTDKEGKFRFENVCAGPISLYANSSGSNQHMYGNTRTEGGAQDVVIVLSTQGGRERYEPKKPAPLAGKDLPDLSAYGLDVPADANSVLVFVWDMQQRPSRYFVKQLAVQEEALTAKGVKVVLLNASKVEKETLDKWLTENKIPFACGMMTVDPENAKFNMGVQGLPWLILTDGEKKVTAEGLAMEDIIKGLN